jgi:hypothetical protein
MSIGEFVLPDCFYYVASFDAVSILKNKISSEVMSSSTKLIVKGKRRKKINFVAQHSL